MEHSLPITLHQLVIFAAVTREGSFTRAAATLTLSEPTVSQQIRLLERSVGGRLLERGPHGPVRPTEAGRLLFATCESVFEQLQSTLAKVEALQRSEHGTVAFGGGTGFCGTLLPVVFASFHRLHPGVTIRVETGTSRHLIDGLLQKRLDLAVVVNATEDQRLALASLASVDLVLIGPPGHPLSGGPPAPFDAIAAERIIVAAEQSSVIRQTLQRKAEEARVQLSVEWEVDDIEAQINAVHNGIGIAPVPAYMLPRGPERYSLLQVRGFPIKLEWYLAWLPDDSSHAMTVFRDYLLSQRAELEATSVLTLKDIPLAEGDLP